MDWDIYDERLFRNREKVKKLVRVKKKGKLFAERIDVPYERLNEYKNSIRNDLKHQSEEYEVYTNFVEFSYRTNHESLNPEKYKDLKSSQFIDLSQTSDLTPVISDMAKQDSSMEALFKELGLSINQQLFVQHYIASRNAVESVKKAGYSPTSAKQASQKLMKSAKVQKAIALCLSKPLDKFDITPEKVIQDLTVIRDRAMQTHPVRDRHGNHMGEFSYDAKGALKAIELMGSYLGMFKNTMRHVGHDGGAIKHEHTVKYDLSALSDEELRYYQERILPKIKTIEILDD